MAVIEWTDEAWQLYNDYLENAKLEYGAKTGRRWERYRRCHMMNRRFKLIYYYDEVKDVVTIMDIWDTRMNPKALIRRIK